MSADNGYIIRKKFEDGQPVFVLQVYFANDEAYPSIDHEAGLKFSSLLDAIQGYQKLEREPFFICEYGLKILVDVESDPR